MDQHDDETHSVPNAQPIGGALKRDRLHHLFRTAQGNAAKIGTGTAKAGKRQLPSMPTLPWNEPIE